MLTITTVITGSMLMVSWFQSTWKAASGNCHSTANSSEVGPRPKWHQSSKLRLHMALAFTSAMVLFSVTKLVVDGISIEHHYKIDLLIHTAYPNSILEGWLFQAGNKRDRYRGSGKPRSCCQNNEGWIEISKTIPHDG